MYFMTILWLVDKQSNLQSTSVIIEMYMYLPEW